MARKTADKAPAQAAGVLPSESVADPVPAPPPASEEAPASGEALPAPVPAEADSATFSRCAGCANAREVDRSVGTLVCAHYNMLVNAELDEIPDDCVAYKPADAPAAAPAPETPPEPPPAPGASL